MLNSRRVWFDYRHDITMFVGEVTIILRLPMITIHIADTYPKMDG